MTGDWPANLVDHIDMNKSNNAWSNLRDATKSQNGKNSRAKRTNKFGLKGVCKVGNRYQAQIGCDGVKHHLGLFGTPEEAHAAYAAAAKELHGEFARAA